MGVLEDLRDFIYLELPQRPVLIKGANAIGDPNASALAKVNNSPIGTYYLRDDVTPKTIWYKAGTASTDQFMLKRDSTSDTTSINVDSTGGVEIIEFSLFSKNVNNRYLNYIDNIPSLIKGYKSNKFKTLKNIRLYGKNNFDSTVFIKDEIGTLIYEIETDNTSNEYSEDVNVLINPNTNIHIFVKSTTGIDYPVILLEVT